MSGLVRWLISPTISKAAPAKTTTGSSHFGNRWVFNQKTPENKSDRAAARSGLVLQNVGEPDQFLWADLPPFLFLSSGWNEPDISSSFTSR